MKSVEALLLLAERHVASLRAAADCDTSEHGVRVLEAEADRWDGLIRETRAELEGHKRAEWWTRAGAILQCDDRSRV